MARNIGNRPYPGTKMNGLMISFVLASALHAGPDSLEGKYTLDPAASDDPAEVVEEATRDVGRIMRGRMRAALEEALTPSRSMEIRLDGDVLLIIGGNERSLRVVPDGREIEQETPQGERARIAATLREGTLEIRIRTPRAERVQTITPTDEGLRVVNALILEQLSQPVRVELIYLREGTPGPGTVGRQFIGRHGAVRAEVAR
jgi:hypothetical protein